MLFEGLGISKALVQRLAELGYTECTPVQETVVPLMQRQRDVVAEAETGSGKTLAYAIPVLDRLLRQGSRKGQTGPQALVVAPTRELAQQIHGVAAELAKGVAEGRVVVESVTGGRQVDEILQQKMQDAAGERAWPQMLVGTPGKILDLCRLGAMPLKGVEVLVLDEADKLLSCGFRREIGEILRLLPRQRQTAVFSATLSEFVRLVSQAGMRSPLYVRVQKKGMLPELLEVHGREAAAGEKERALLEELGRVRQGRKNLVFFATCAQVEYFHGRLSGLADAGLGPRMLKLHRKMPQSAREQSYAEYARMEEGVLLSTDIAARGLDFAGVSGVVHFDLPQDPATFVHRAGRTARCGRSGACVIMYMPSEAGYLEFLRARGITASLGSEETAETQEVREAAERALCWLDAQEASKKDVENRRAHTDADSAQPDTTIVKPDIQAKRTHSPGLLAFVSYVRSYKEHLLTHVLDYRRLDYAGLLSLYRLKRLPRMEELRSMRIPEFGPQVEEAPAGNKERSRAPRLLRRKRKGTDIWTQKTQSFRTKK